MKVALVNPPFSKLVYGQEHTIKSITPCLGLFYMQSYCADIADIKVFEGEFYRSLEDLGNDVNNFGPDVLGITTNTTTWPLCCELARNVEARWKLAGGPYSPFRIEESLEYFDGVCLGDGEVPLRALVMSGSLEETPGMAWRSRQGTIQWGKPAQLLHLDKFPNPQPESLNLGMYQASPHRELREPFATMVTTRGCGFACTFCLSASGGFNRGKYRERSVDNVVREIRKLKEIYDIRSIQFWDDTFTMRTERTKELCRALKEEDILYVCNTRTDKIDTEIADYLASSGCVGVFFGIESGAEAILRNDHKKGVRNHQVQDAVSTCKKAGMRTTTSFIFGSIDDTVDSIEETIDFSLDLDSDYVLYNIYTAHPGTSGYQRAVQEQVIDEYTVDLDMYYGEPVGIPTVCRDVNREDLLKKKAEAYIRFYTQKDPAMYKNIISTYRAEIA